VKLIKFYFEANNNTHTKHTHTHTHTWRHTRQIFRQSL